MNDAVSFPVAWGDVEFIPGWLSREEGQLLYSCALNTPRDSTFIEVGTYRGKSTSLLAKSQRHVIAIDPMRLGMDLGNRLSISESDIAALSHLAKASPNISWQPMCGGVNAICVRPPS